MNTVSTDKQGGKNAKGGLFYNRSIKKLTLTGFFLATALLLPFLTGQIPQIGVLLSPMHIPILICGFVCGWQYGLSLGLIAPILRFLLFGMPPIYPVGLAMSFELAAYGAGTGLLYKFLAKKTFFIYLNLIVSMIFGRIVWGCAMLVLANISNFQFGLNSFLTGAFLNTLPGIILHIITVPLAILLLKRVKLVFNE